MIYLLKRNSLCIPLLCFILFAVRKRCFWSRYGDMLSARGGPQWRTNVNYDEIIGTFVLHISGHFLFFIYFLLFSYLLFFLLFSKFFAYFQLFINSLYILRILPLPIFYILSSFFLSSIFSVFIVYFWQKEILILVEQNLKFLN